MSANLLRTAFFQELKKYNIKWEFVEIFQLGEYLGMPIDHVDSIYRCFMEEFIQTVFPGKIHLINGEECPEKTIKLLTDAINESAIDLAIVGVSDSADFVVNDLLDAEDKSAYKVVAINEAKVEKQNFGLLNVADKFYDKAISITVKQILKCENIIGVMRSINSKDDCKLVDDNITTIPANVFKDHLNYTVYCCNE